MDTLRLVVTGVVLLYQRGCTDNIIVGCFTSGGLKCDTHRFALPHSLLADRSGGGGLRPLANLLLNNCAARPKLRNNYE